MIFQCFVVFPCFFVVDRVSKNHCSLLFYHGHWLLAGRWPSHNQNHTQHTTHHKPSRVKPNRTTPSRTEPSRAKPSHATSRHAKTGHKGIWTRPVYRRTGAPAQQCVRARRVGARNEASKGGCFDPGKSRGPKGAGPTG